MERRDDCRIYRAEANLEVGVPLFLSDLILSDLATHCPEGLLYCCCCRSERIGAINNHTPVSNIFAIMQSKGTKIGEKTVMVAKLDELKLHKASDSNHINRTGANAQPSSLAVSDLVICDLEALLLDQVSLRLRDVQPPMLGLLQ